MALEAQSQGTRFGGERSRAGRTVTVRQAGGLVNADQDLPFPGERHLATDVLIHHERKRVHTGILLALQEQAQPLTLLSHWFFLLLLLSHWLFTHSLFSDWLITHSQLLPHLPRQDGKKTPLLTILAVPFPSDSACTTTHTDCLRSTPHILHLPSFTLISSSTFPC